MSSGSTDEPPIKKLRRESGAEGSESICVNFKDGSDIFTVSKGIYSDSEPLQTLFPDNDKIDYGKPAVFYDNGKGFTEAMSYGDLDIAANFIKSSLEKLISNEYDLKFIGVRCDLGVTYPAIILGILRSQNAFFNVEPGNWQEDISSAVNHLNIKYVICESMWKPTSLAEFVSFKLNKAFNIQIPIKCASDLTIYEIISKSETLPDNVSQCSNSSKPGYFAYAIQTSGTTGRRKTVLVPHTCITPNILDFAYTTWKLTPQDVIFGCAPPTFDPHIVELFASLAAGATILYTTSEVKNNAFLLIKVFSFHRVTILQITPSLFRSTVHSLNRVKTGSTNFSIFLRIVAFGGEKCPNIEEIRMMRKILETAVALSTDTIVFQNVYGVTEVSCWASVCFIDLSNDGENIDKPIPIGKGLLDTEVHIKGSVNYGEIVITSNIRRCVIIDPSFTSAAYAINLQQHAASGCEYRTGDMGRLTDSGIIFEGRMDKIVKRNGMKVSLFQIEEMALGSGLLIFAECTLHKDNKIYLFVKVKPEFWQSEAQQQVSLLPSSLSKKFDIPLFMYPDYIIDLNDIPLNTNGKIDLNFMITTLLTKEGKAEVQPDNLYKPSVSYNITIDQIIKTVEPIWRSCTWSGLRPIEDILNENFFECGGTSISATRFVESTFLSLKLFGTEAHGKCEGKLKQHLTKCSFKSVTQLIYDEIISVPGHQPNSNTNFNVNVSSFRTILPETQEVLRYPIILNEGNIKFFKDTCHHPFEYEMLDDDLKIEEESSFVFIATDNSNRDDVAKINIKYPIQLVNMTDFSLSLCVDASPAIVFRKSDRIRADSCDTMEKAVVGCHGGTLICVDLTSLRQNHSLLIAWKRKMLGRLEASVIVDESALFGFVGSHDCNFYKFAISNGKTICFATCSAQIRSKAVISKEYERVIVIDSGNNIYCLSINDLNVIWVNKCYEILATTCPLIWRNLCYVTTLNNGVICLDLQNGSEIWKSCVLSSRSQYFCSSPTLTVKSKRRALIFIGILSINDNLEGIQAINAKTGVIEWKYETGTSGRVESANVFQPIYGKCCETVIWTCSSHSKLKCIHPSTGKCMQDLQICGDDSLHDIGESGREDGFGAKWSCLLDCQSESDEENIRRIRIHSECVLFYKTQGANLFNFVNLHKSQIIRSKPWFLMKNFETFSVPVRLNEFILLGGRDNKLHIIKCACQRNKNVFSAGAGRSSK